MKTFSRKYSVVAAVTALVASSFVAQVTPANADTLSSFATQYAQPHMSRPLNLQHQVTFTTGERIYIDYFSSLNSTALSGLHSGDVLTLNPHFSMTGTVSNEYVESGLSSSDGYNSANLKTAMTFTLTGASQSRADASFFYDAIATSTVVITFNPEFLVGSTAFTSADFTQWSYLDLETYSEFGESSNIVAKADDTALKFDVPGACIAANSVTAGDVLTLTATITDGTSNNLGTLQPYWATWIGGNNSSYDDGQSATYTAPVFQHTTDLINIHTNISLDSVTAGKTYSVYQFKVTKNGVEVPLVGCTTVAATGAAVSVDGSNVHLGLNLTPDAAYGYVQFGGYSCLLYALSDTTHSTVVARAAVAIDDPTVTSATCSFTNVPNGNYTVGIRGKQPVRTSSEKFLPGVVTVGPKSDPTFPTVASKVTKGKSITIALSSTLGTKTQGKTTQGLNFSASVNSAAKKFCTVTAVKNSAKKITGYSIKGVKKSASSCKVNLSITGDGQYNSKAKTVTVKVV